MLYMYQNGKYQQRHHKPRKLTPAHHRLIRLLAERIYDKHVQRQQNIAHKVARVMELDK